MCDSVVLEIHEVWRPSVILDDDPDDGTRCSFGKAICWGFGGKGGQAYGSPQM